MKILKILGVLALVVILVIIGVFTYVKIAFKYVFGSPGITLGLTHAKLSATFAN